MTTQLNGSLTLAFGDYQHMYHVFMIHIPVAKTIPGADDADKIDSLRSTGFMWLDFWLTAREQAGWKYEKEEEKN